MSGDLKTPPNGCRPLETRGIDPAAAGEILSQTVVSGLTILRQVVTLEPEADMSEIGITIRATALLSDVMDCPGPCEQSDKGCLLNFLAEETRQDLGKDGIYVALSLYSHPKTK